MLVKHPERAARLNDVMDCNESSRAVMVWFSTPTADEVAWRIAPLNDPNSRGIEIVLWSDGSVLLTPIDADGLSTGDGVDFLYPSQVNDLYDLLSGQRQHV